MDPDVAVAALAALGHSVRLAVWRLLLPHGRIGLSAGTISAKLAVPASSLSFHLQQMTQAEVLVQRRFSRQIIYAVNEEIIAALCDFLSCTGEKLMCMSAGALSQGEPADINGQG